jgi:serine/threonine protein kinase
LNCVVGIDGYIKLIDYGLAAVLGKGKKAHTVCGTRYYFAPEMIRRKGGYDVLIYCRSSSILSTVLILYSLYPLLYCTHTALVL